MEKLTWFAHLLPSVGKDERREWRQTLGAALAGVPGLKGFTVSEAMGPHPTVSGASEEEVLFDSYSCAWFSDHETLERALTSPAWRDLLESSFALFDRDWQRNMSAVVEERTLKEGEQSPFKAVWVLRFRKDLDRAWVRDFWTKEHAHFVLEAPGVDRYLQNHVVAAIGEDGSLGAPEAVGFDGFAECWFPDEAAFLEAVTSPQWAGLVAEGADMFDMSFLWGAVLQEQDVAVPVA